VAILNEVKQVGNEQRQTAMADVKLIALEGGGHRVPVLQETMSVDVGKFCKRILDVGPKLRMKELEDIGGPHMAQYDCRVDVVVLPAIRRSIQVRCENGPPERFILVGRWFGTRRTSRQWRCARFARA